MIRHSNKVFLYFTTVTAQSAANIYFMPGEKWEIDIVFKLTNPMSILIAIFNTINSFPPAGFSVWQSDGENGDNVVAGQMSGYDWMTGHLAPIKQLLLLLHTQSAGEHLAHSQQPSCTLNWSVDAIEMSTKFCATQYYEKPHKAFYSTFTLTKLGGKTKFKCLFIIVPSYVWWQNVKLWTARFRWHL